MIILMVILALVFISVHFGWKDSTQVDILIEIKSMSHHFFHLGLSHTQHVEEEYIEEEFVIGLFFINFVVVFFKEIEA